MSARKGQARQRKGRRQGTTPHSGSRQVREWGKLTSGITALTAVAALLFTALSLQQTRAQNQLAQSGQITDRFNAAVTNLGSTTMTIRIGGIYALQRIMQDSPRDQPAAIQVLAAFIRQGGTSHANAPTGSLPDRAATAEKPPIDVQTALTVIGTRDPSQDQKAGIDLDGADLRGANLIEMNLAGADLQGVDLAYADLSNGDFINTFFNDADLENALGVEADVAGANFTNADLSGAIFDSANFDDARLYGANLQDAQIEGARLHNAYLESAEFLGAKLAGTDLTGADLADATFDGADLTNATFSSKLWCAGTESLKPSGYACLHSPAGPVVPSPTGP